jgi:hypothetical protein
MRKRTANHGWWPTRSSSETHATRLPTLFSHIRQLRAKPKLPNEEQKLLQQEKTNLQEQGLVGTQNRTSRLRMNQPHGAAPYSGPKSNWSQFKKKNSLGTLHIIGLASWIRARITFHRFCVSTHHSTQELWAREQHPFPFLSFKTLCSCLKNQDRRTISSKIH